MLCFCCTIVDDNESRAASEFYKMEYISFTLSNTIHPKWAPRPKIFRVQWWWRSDRLVKGSHHRWCQLLPIHLQHLPRTTKIPNRNSGVRSYFLLRLHQSGDQEFNSANRERIGEMSELLHYFQICSHREYLQWVESASSSLLCNWCSLWIWVWTCIQYRLHDRARDVELHETSSRLPEHRLRLAYGWWWDGHPSWAVCSSARLLRTLPCAKASVRN